MQIDYTLTTLQNPRRPLGCVYVGTGDRRLVHPALVVVRIVVGCETVGVVLDTVISALVSVLGAVKLTIVNEHASPLVRSAPLYIKGRESMVYSTITALCGLPLDFRV